MKIESAGRFETNFLIFSFFNFYFDVFHLLEKGQPSQTNIVFRRLVSLHFHLKKTNFSNVIKICMMVVLTELYLFMVVVGIF